MQHFIWGDLKPPQIRFCWFVGPPFARTKNIKTSILPKSINISKNTTLDAQGLNFDDFLMPLGPPFWINFRDYLNLLNCNKYNAIDIFLQFPASHFGTEVHNKIMLVRTRFLDICCHCMLNLEFVTKKGSHGTPFTIQWIYIYIYVYIYIYIILFLARLLPAPPT